MAHPDTSNEHIAMNLHLAFSAPVYMDEECTVTNGERFVHAIMFA